VAVCGSRVEALGGDLFEIICRHQDVELPRGAAADLIGAVQAGHRDGHNLSFLQQYDIGMDDGHAQRIGYGSAHDRSPGGESRGEDQEETEAKWPEVLAPRSNRHENPFFSRNEGARTSIDASHRSDAQALEREW
jgi:hypothetical protein